MSVVLSTAVFSRVSRCVSPTPIKPRYLVGNPHSFITTIVVLVTSVYRCAILPLGGAAVHKNITHRAQARNVHLSYIINAPSIISVISDTGGDGALSSQAPLY